MSFLQINRLIVVKDGEKAYDEKFHSGVNIIRGTNASGKSTIANFIFYVLGGDYFHWLPEAMSCSYVISEVQINGSIYTLKREIDPQQQRPMYIFWGMIEDALKSNYEGWNKFGYRRFEQTESFSKILFKALNFPEVSTQNQESITMHQILRFMYIDQISPLNSLLLTQDFDSPLIRQTTGSLLFGTYEDSLYDKQQLLGRRKKELSVIKDQIKSIQNIFSSQSISFNQDKIQTDIEQARDQLSKIDKALERPEEQLLDTGKAEGTKPIEELKTNLTTAKYKYQELLNKLDTLFAQIIDNKEFLAVLDEKLNAINQSLITRDSLDNLTISICPVCLEEIENSEDGHCILCKKELSSDPRGKANLLKMQFEVEMQKKESKSILSKKEKEYAGLCLKKATLKSDLNRKQKDFNLYIKQTQSTTSRKYNDLLIKKGELSTKLVYLLKQYELLSSFEELKKQRNRLSTSIESLAGEIDGLILKQREKEKNANSKVQEIALSLLSEDGKYEDSFIGGRSIAPNFYKNSFSLDDRNNYSASSMVILKNSIRFAILFASLELDFFRYPRFILCDNIEDKGMEEERSHGFQKNIVALSESDKAKNIDHQIIFTTSMISPALNINKYTIGDSYKPAKKSLKL